jgi:hypothetical protein
MRLTVFRPQSAVKNQHLLFYKTLLNPLPKFNRQFASLNSIEGLLFYSWILGRSRGRQVARKWVVEKRKVKPQRLLHSSLLPNHYAVCFPRIYRGSNFIDESTVKPRKASSKNPWPVDSYRVFLREVEQRYPTASRRATKASEEYKRIHRPLAKLGGTPNSYLIV